MKIACILAFGFYLLTGLLLAFGVLDSTRVIAPTGWLISAVLVFLLYHATDTE